MKPIKIATKGVPHDYRSTLLPIVIANMGYRIDWVEPSSADLLIVGPFAEKNAKPYRWCPKPFRPIIGKVMDSARGKKEHQTLTLFHTQENERHDYLPTDYSISFDLGVLSEKHFRLPYWMEMLDWSHEGISGNSNPRYGELLQIATLMTPLGNRYLNRNGACALLSSHLREPRGSLFSALEKVVPTHGFGAFFNKDIKDHHSSGFLKKDILQEFSYNLCPENGLYPGYYTEKIPEAFNSGCLPITWADENISVDFNPKAFLNMQPLFKNNFKDLAALFSEREKLESFQAQPLLLERPTIEPLKAFLKEILDKART